MVWAAAIKVDKEKRQTSCESFVITFKPERHPQSEGSTSNSREDSMGEVHLNVTDVRLLRHSKLPPHFVMANPLEDAVLLGLDPDSSGSDLQDEEDTMHIDCRKTGGCSVQMIAT